MVKIYLFIVLLTVVGFVGRGTRLCRELACIGIIDGEYTDKRRFLIFDYYGNFEFSSLSEMDKHDLTKYIALLVSNRDNDEYAKRFDNFMYGNKSEISMQNSQYALFGSTNSMLAEIVY